MKKFFQLLIVIIFPFLFYGQEGKIQVDSPYSNAKPGETVGETSSGAKVTKVTNGKPVSWTGKGRSNGGETMSAPSDPSIGFYCSSCRIEYSPNEGGKVVNQDYNGKKDVVYEGTIKGDNGLVYSGKILNGVPHKNGTLRYPDGAVYEGEFDKGVRKGTGNVKFVLEDGTTATYDGEWDNDKWNGSGVYSNSTVTISGDVFKNGQITGAKAKVQEKGKKGYYEGGIKNGKLNDIGTIYNEAGRVSGTYKYKDGEIKAIVLSNESKKAIQKIREIIEDSSFGEDILTAFTLYTTFSIYDDEPIVFISNVHQVLDRSEKGQDFYTLIAKGVRDLNKIKYQQIKKVADYRHFKAMKENNIAETNFWKQFKLIVKLKSKPGSGGFIPD